MNLRYLVSLVVLVVVGFFVGRALAQAPPSSGAAQKPAPPPTNCKVYGPGRCCDPAAAAHLTKEAIYAACGESDATFLGEQGQKDTCKYFFKVAGAKEDETFVQVYAPATKEVPDSPTDPFFKWGTHRQGLLHREGAVAEVGADDRERDRAVAAGEGLLRRGQRVDQGLRQGADAPARRQDEVARSRRARRRAAHPRRRASRTRTHTDADHDCRRSCSRP